VSVQVKRRDPQFDKCGVRCIGCAESCTVEVSVDSTFMRACTPCLVKVAKAIGAWLVLTDKPAHKELAEFYGVKGSR
jgi:hypothetical protein